jgi:hypothetical protein
MLAATASQIIGSIILISIIIPYFLAVAFAILICYAFAAYFYRASARELKVGLFVLFRRFSTDAEPTAPGCHLAVLTLFPFFRVIIGFNHHPRLWRTRAVPRGKYRAH